MSNVSPIPEGFHTVTPYLIIRGAAKAMEYYQASFGAKEVMRLPMGDKIGHAEMQIGSSRIMLADEMPEMEIKGPESIGGTPVGICIYTEDCDAMFDQAIAGGGKVSRPMADQFYGDRMGTLIDPFGHQWTVGTHKEDLSPEEIAERMKNMGPQDCGKTDSE
jgi:PhnB protein